MLLTAAGALPFVWGLATMLSEPLGLWAIQTLGTRFFGPFVMQSYGTIILCFMSGVLWGFATKGEGAVAASGYALSVLPALWAFFFVTPGTWGIALIAGFIAVLALDWMFWRQGLAPAWWMRLRVPVTLVVCLCLGLGGV